MIKKYCQRHDQIYYQILQDGINLNSIFYLLEVCFVQEMDFTGLHLDIALRHLYQEVSPPASDAQKIEKIIEVFARRYIICNQMFASGFRYVYFRLFQLFV